MRPPPALPPPNRGGDGGGVADKRAFLQAVILSGEAVVKFAHRHAELAERLAAEAKNPRQRREFLQIAVHCRHVPENPPRTFYEALQSFWLLHLVFHCTMDNLACGRFDQYMYPFFKRDVERGNLTLNAAQEMLDCLFLKFNERVESNRDEIESRVDLEKREREMEEAWGRRSAFGSGQKLMARDRIDATNHWLQNIIVGGLKPDGADGTNELTFLCLEAYRRNEMTNPVMTVRLHRHSPDALVRKACEVIRQGGGMPAIFNDEALIPAIQAMGIPTEDARDYCNDGCWETIIAGKTDFRFTRFGLLRCLEWALNRGVSRVDGKKESIDTGDPRTFKTFDDVMNAFKAQLDYQMQGIVTQRAERWTDRACIAPVPLLSSLLDGPVETATDMTAGGAKYITFGIIGDGGAHAFDSLAAIKKVVFDDGAATMSELMDALDNNFTDRPDLRRKLLDAPKYGNDDDYADSIARECVAYFTERVRHYAQQYPYMKFPTGVGTFSWYVAIGGGLGASPDGRLFAEPVSSNFSPALGADVNGPCAAVKSHAKMEMMNLPVGSPLDLRLDTKLVTGKEGLQRLTAFVRSFIECGGNMMTITVTDVETLRKAQREPEKYRNLRVRMGGWSAYFTALSKEQQEHHIRRQGGR